MNKLFEAHPWVEEFRDLWEFFLLSYEGGRLYVNWNRGRGPFLHRHAREGDADYRSRRRRSVYPNYCRPIVKIYQSHITRKGIIRKSEDEDFIEFLKDVNRGGLDADAFFMGRVFPLVQVLGFVILVVDMPRGEAMTEAERKERGLRPYCVCYTPLELVNWEAEEGKNKFKWVILKEERLNREGKIEIYYRFWSEEEWALYSEKGEKIEGGEHPLGEVPAVVVVNEWSLIYPWPIGLSALNTIAELNQEIYNLNSLQQEFLYKQCFPQLLLDEDMIGKIIEMGISQAIPVSKDAFVPQYLVPEAEPARFLQEKIDSLRQEIYRHAIIRDTAAVTAPAESGISKAFDFHDANQVSIPFRGC